MYFVYSILLALGLVLMLPMFLMRREKYAAGFKQRLGNYPNFEDDGRPVIWLHCVSVGETNAARPLVDGIVRDLPGYRLVVSTTTRTGQELAQTIFAEKADAIVYFPFDFKFSVRRAIKKYKPSLVLLMETEIWPRFIREAKRSGARVAIVSGRLSKRSFGRYARIRPFISRVLKNVDLALMQGEDDLRAIIGLGMDPTKAAETGNLKYDLEIDTHETKTATDLRERFGFGRSSYLIVAASTHQPEEKLILSAFKRLENSLQTKPRLLLAPRHPERFDEVAQLAAETHYQVARRSSTPSPDDKDAEVVILDSIGELRSVFPLADLVFVGGSLIRHGGQSILEPAAAGRATVLGPYTHNFKEILNEFLERQAVIQLKPEDSEAAYVEALANRFLGLLTDPTKRENLGRNARSVMDTNRGATARTVDLLREITDN